MTKAGLTVAGEKSLRFHEEGTLRVARFEETVSYSSRRTQYQSSYCRKTLKEPQLFLGGNVSVTYRILILLLDTETIIYFTMSFDTLLY